MQKSPMGQVIARKEIQRPQKRQRPQVKDQHPGGDPKFRQLSKGLDIFSRNELAVIQDGKDDTKKTPQSHHITVPGMQTKTEDHGCQPKDREKHEEKEDNPPQYLYPDDQIIEITIHPEFRPGKTIIQRCIDLAVNDTRQ